MMHFLQLLLSRGRGGSIQPMPPVPSPCRNAEAVSGAPLKQRAAGCCGLGHSFFVGVGAGGGGVPGFQQSSGNFRAPGWNP